MMNANRDAILILEGAIEQTFIDQAAAEKQAAAPFIMKRANLQESLAQLKRKELNQVPYTGKKRGRKPKILNFGGYSKNATVAFKLVYVINEAGKFISINEIANRVKQYEPNESVLGIKIRFTKHMNKFRDKGIIYSYKVEDNNRFTFYGLPRWIKDGKPLPGREHESTELVDESLLEETSRNPLLTPMVSDYMRMVNKAKEDKERQIKKLEKNNQVS